MTQRTDERRRLASLAILATLVLSVGEPLLAAGPSVRVETRDGEAHGVLKGISRAAGVELLADSPVRYPREDVLAIRYDAADREAETETFEGVVTLRGGDVIPYQAAAFDGERLRLTITEGVSERGRPSVADASLAALREWRRFGARDQSARETWEDAVEAYAGADLLLVRSRSRARLTPVAGALVGIDPRGVRFVPEGSQAGDPVAVAWDRLVALSLADSDASPADPSEVTIEGRGGLRLRGTSLLADTEGVEWSSPDAKGWVSHRLLERLDLTRGRVIAAADLPRRALRWRPYFGEGADGDEALDAGIALDRSLAGAPLSLRFADPRLPEAWPEVATERLYDRGVAVRSEGELRLALPDDANELRGWVGIDPATRRVGSAEVAILADGQTLWSGRVDGRTAPVLVRASVAGARVLELRVGYGDNLDAGDNVHFADLKVLR